MELRFDQASRRFGEQLAFEIPQLAIRSGELFAFVGPANAGKSTVLNVIAGVERLSSGTLTAAGRILNDVPEAERDAVLVPPARLLDPGPQSILLFDDPLRASAAGERDRLLAGLKRLHAARRSTFILATADQAQALALADRLAVMADGRLHQVGSAAEIVDAPATTFVASYFGAPPMNVVPGILEKDGQAV